MKSFWLALVASCVVTAAVAASVQRLNPSGREIFGNARALQAPEIAVVLDAARAAISGRTLRLSYVPGGAGPEVLMGANGRPRYVRSVSGGEFGGSWSVDANGKPVTGASVRVDIIRLTEYTGRTARKCDGTALSDELVIDYEVKSTDARRAPWTARARTRTAHEALWPAFDILAGNLPAESGDRRTLEGREARALVAPWKPPAGSQPGGPLPAGATQALWIDVATMLPLRWSIAVPAAPEQGVAAIPDYGLSFTYDPSLDLRPPPDVTLPTDCIS
jgi:hypothetical protein